MTIEKKRFDVSIVFGISKNNCLANVCGAFFPWYGQICSV